MIIKKHHIKFYTFRINQSCWTLNKIRLQSLLILLSDGSFTQNLNSIIGREIKVKLIQQNLIPNKYVIRQVWIEDLYKNRMAFAESLWQTTNFKQSQINNYTPIGKSMILDELDISKEIRHIYYGYDYFMEKAFKIKLPILSREYIILYHKIPLANIKEFFSPNLRNII